MSADIIVILLIIGLVALILFFKNKPGFFAPTFEARPLMNKPERFLFDLLRREFPSKWHVMSQVSYGAFLKNTDRNKYMSINSKRADFVVLVPSLEVAAVFEYQGKGHYGFSDESKRRAQLSDQIKRQACAEAAIYFVEVPAYVDQNEMRSIIRDIVHPPEVDPNI